jgi:hypothetical protein
MIEGTFNLVVAISMPSIILIDRAPALMWIVKNNVLSKSGKAKG